VLLSAKKDSERVNTNQAFDSLILIKYNGGKGVVNRLRVNHIIHMIKIRIQIWLSRMSKRLDSYFTKRFWINQNRNVKKLIDSIDLNADGITFK